ncbi:Stem-specific protein TSJT1 [Acorus calamus]|uniref:Stem-specific protein TSJT1 n=1 Tax=Acorus calamus TaxID=4465 RepID=A0AAV9ETG6_ACOCL|nr:Stem-specific protein TSJT1 [Acorus calamus]
MFCLFQGHLDNVVSLKQQYGLNKTANEVIIVIEAYRTLRDRALPCGPGCKRLTWELRIHPFRQLQQSHLHCCYLGKNEQVNERERSGRNKEM